MRFNEAFHQSDIQLYKRCPQAFKYARLLKETSDYITIPMIHGIAIHNALYIIHLNKLFDYGEEKLQKLYINCLYTAEFEEDRSPVKWIEREKDIANLAEKAVIVLKNYISKNFNRNCTVIESETEFALELGKYKFEGRIDQLREYNGDIYLVDFKSGVSPAPSEWNMKLSYQLGLYAIASSECFGYMPKYVGIYRLQDHIPYEKTTWLHPSALYNKQTSWLDWFGKQHAPRVDEYEKLTEKKSRKIDRDEFAFMPGMERGPGLYYIKFTPEIAHNIKNDIIRVCAAIRRNEYYRNDSSCNMCRFRGPCELDLDMENSKDKVEAITGW